MAGRPRRPLWRRPYSSYRVGERRRPDVGDEPQRLTLFLAGRLLDLAETLSMRAGAGSVQRYCEGLLSGALEAERARLQIESTEAKHGRLGGFRAIEDDPEFLAEISATVAHPPGPSADPEIHFLPEPPMALPAPKASAAASTVIAHASLDSDDPTGFLAALRRGEAPTSEAVEMLSEALIALDAELKGAPSIDRRLAYALHRLALESQVLHTDAWPGTFDAWTLEAIRAVQAAVDRLLSATSRQAEPGSSRPTPETSP